MLSLARNIDFHREAAWRAMDSTANASNDPGLRHESRNMNLTREPSGSERPPSSRGPPAAISSRGPLRTSHRPFLSPILGDLSALGRRQRDIVFILKDTTLIAKIVDRALRPEAIAVHFVDRIAGDPKLVATLSRNLHGLGA